MSTRIHELGELQLAVLNVLWTRRQATVHEVVAALPSDDRHRVLPRIGHNPPQEDPHAFADAVLELMRV